MLFLLEIRVMGKEFYLFRKKMTLTFLYILQCLFKEVMLLGGLTCAPCIGMCCIWLQQQQWNCWGMGPILRSFLFSNIFEVRLVLNWVIIR